MNRTKLAALIAAAGAAALIGVAAANGSAASPRPTTAAVHAFADPDEAVGSSRLRRTDEGVRMKLRATGLLPREADTVWWVVFNQPDECTPPDCGSDDIFVGGDPANPLNDTQIEAADIVAAYATGKVASRSGRSTFHAALDEGEPAGTREIVIGDGPTLVDATGAEIHLVVRSHGPAVRGLVGEQTGSFAGGCNVFLNPPAVPDETGECADTLFAVHRPAEVG